MASGEGSIRRRDALASGRRENIEPSLQQHHPRLIDNVKERQRRGIAISSYGWAKSSWDAPVSIHSHGADFYVHVLQGLMSRETTSVATPKCY
jgi:hypothetical protein